MGSLHDEKHSDEVHDQKHSEVVTTKTAIGDGAYQQALMKEPPKHFSSALLIIASAVAFCCSTANGYDGSLFGTLLSNKDFKAFFGVANKGIEAGIVTAMYQIGQMVALPFVGPAIDTWGRRPGMFIGAVTILIGVVIQLTCVLTNSVGQFMAGRFFLGFGVSIIGSAGPVYVIEISHPAHRGVVTGLYNVMWPVGALVASGAVRGGLGYGGHTSWMIPVGVQMMFPGIICLFSLLLPESPRWLYTRNKQQQATDVLVKLHGNGNPESEWVKLQLSEYEEFLEMNGADKKWWDYSALFRNRASIYRAVCCGAVQLFGQWAGNGIVSYYLSAFLDTAGIVGSEKQVDVAMGMNAVQIVFAMVGASIVDLVGRRPMLVIANIACGICWIGVIVPASIANITDADDEAQRAAVSDNVSRAMLAMVYIFQICYSVGWTPLQALVPVEVLSFEMRAKGMAFGTLFMNFGLLANQFGIPVALEDIQWKTYIVFCVWCFVQAGIMYVFVPETKNRTLEELDNIFNAPNPVKASTQKHVFALDSSANIVNIETATQATSKA